ncbi:14954_t:CDS:2, partial [Gigaspora margarita]
FEINLKNIKDFTTKVSKLKGYRKFFSATNVKCQYENLTKEYDGCINNLHFAIVVVSKEKRETELRKVDQSLKDIEETLEKLEGDIENAANKIENKIEQVGNNIGSKMDMIVQKISIIKSQIDKQQSNNINDINVPKIDAKELIHPLHPESNDVQGSHRPLHKKFYKGCKVACKPIEDSKTSKRLQDKLTILGKLGLSPNILRFYGLSYIDNHKVIVSEWAKYRNIPNYVLSGKHEKLLYGKFTNPDDEKIQGEFIKIIDSEGLAITYPIPITSNAPSGLLPDKSLDFDRTITSKVKDSLMPNFSEEFSINEKDFIDS